MVDGFLKKYSKVITRVVGLVLLIAVSVSVYRHYTGPAEAIYQDPPSVHIDAPRIPEELKGNIVTLKKLRPEHVADYHAMFSDDVREGFRFWAQENYQFTQNYVLHNINRMEEGEIMAYAVFDNADNCLIGSVEARGMHQEDPGQIGTWLNENYRGRGRIQEALKLLINAYFDLTGEKRINVFVETFNKRSYKSLQKAGFKQSGFARMNHKKFNILDFTKE